MLNVGVETTENPTFPSFQQAGFIPGYCFHPPAQKKISRNRVLGVHVLKQFYDDRFILHRADYMCGSTNNKPET